MICYIEHGEKTSAQHQHYNIKALTLTAIDFSDCFQRSKCFSFLCRELFGFRLLQRMSIFLRLLCLTVFEDNSWIHAWHLTLQLLFDDVTFYWEWSVQQMCFYLYILDLGEDHLNMWWLFVTSCRIWEHLLNVSHIPLFPVYKNGVCTCEHSRPQQSVSEDKCHRNA